MRKKRLGLYTLYSKPSNTSRRVNLWRDRKIAKEREREREKTSEIGRERERKRERVRRTDKQKKNESEGQRDRYTNTRETERNLITTHYNTLITCWMPARSCCSKTCPCSLIVQKSIMIQQRVRETHKHTTQSTLNLMSPQKHHDSAKREREKNAPPRTLYSTNTQLNEHTQA